jgi:ATP-binding cassette subfamily F protein 3
MIKLTNLSKSFGNRLLFQEVGFSVHKKEKIGIIGRNGYGKSTLLKMISGEQQPEEGEIIIPKDYRIAELSQHIHFTEETVLSEAKKGLRPEQKDEIWKAEMILSGLGFTEEDFQKSPHEFSGGYQIRINLAKALLCEPDMLLLDEPTNYLDIVSLRWMERFLQKWKRRIFTGHA